LIDDQVEVVGRTPPVRRNSAAGGQWISRLQWESRECNERAVRLAGPFEVYRPNFKGFLAQRQVSEGFASGHIEDAFDDAIGGSEGVPREEFLG